MRGVIYLLFACVLVGCGNSSRSNQDADYSDSAMAIPEVVDTFSAPIQENTSTPPAENAANHGAPIGVTSINSDKYDEGYDQGYTDGEEDSYTHSGYQASFDDSNSFSGKAAYDYEDGYENGYENGYYDNVESGEEE